MADKFRYKGYDIRKRILYDEGKMVKVYEIWNGHIKISDLGSSIMDAKAIINKRINDLI